jgi:hypothetical protein
VPEEALRVVGLDPKEIEKTGGLRSLIPVLAPLSGTVIERTLTAGQFVQGDGTALLTIADLSTVWVLLDVFETDIHVVHPGLKVAVTAAAYPSQRFMAAVDRISDKVDPDTRTLKVRLLVSNPGLLLKPEMFIFASLELSAVTNGVTVPATAVFTEDDKSYLFVAAGDRRFERRLAAVVRRLHVHRQAVVQQVERERPHPVEDLGELLDRGISGATLRASSSAMARVIETTPNAARYFVGMMVWDDDQLEQQVAGGLWEVRPADADFVLPAKAPGLWNSLRKPMAIGRSNFSFSTMVRPML